MDSNIPELLSKMEQGKKTAQKLADKRDKLLAELKEHGFANFEELNQFLKAAEAMTGPGKPKKVAARPAARSGRNTRTSEADRQKAIELIKAGKTSKEVGRIIGKSVPTIQNIKRDAGLVKKVAKKAARKISKKAARKAVKKATKKTVKKAATKAVKKAAKEAAK